jgi:hypothetical protein
MRLFAFAIVLLAAPPTSADLAVKQSATDEWGAPNLALRVQSRGENKVQFVLYASGRVLYRDRAGGNQPYDYLFVALTPEEKRTLLDGLKPDLVGPHPPSELRQKCFDCATYCVDAWSPAGRKRECVLGFPSEKMEPELSAIWDRLLRFVSPRATRWVPKQVTVTVRSSSLGGASSSVDWPQHWPTSGVPIGQFGHDGWTFVLDGSKLPELRRVQAQCFDHSRMLPLKVTDGGYVAMSFDYALPHEDSWQRE